MNRPGTLPGVLTVAVCFNQIMKTLIPAVVVFGCALSLSAQTIADFESYENGASVMFRHPGFSGSTSGNLDIALYNFTGVTNVFPAGNPNAGANVLNTLFTFKPAVASPWLRLTSNGAPNLPNPTILFAASLSFDIYTDKPIYVTLLLRETNTLEPVGGNGGTSGGIEFVGGSPTVDPKGKAIPANAWTKVTFDVPNEAVAAFAGATANGILESTSGKGVLEALGLSTDANGEGTWNIYLDNFQVQAVPEPSSLALAGLGALAFLARRRSQA